MNITVPESEFNTDAPSTRCAIKMMWAMYTVLTEQDGAASPTMIKQEILNRVELTEWERQAYESSGNVRWQSLLHFFSIDAVKAGFITKSKGLWSLTNEGRSAMKKGPRGVFEEARRLYGLWRSETKEAATAGQPSSAVGEELDVRSEKTRRARIEELEESSREDLGRYISGMNPYEFQDLVAALLRSMGYYTPFIATRGPDGGIDIIAYQDPLGATQPRIKVQVKHKPNSAVPVDDIRSLRGLLSTSGEIGLFVTSGRFTRDAELLARDAGSFVRLMDLDALLEMWVEHYSKLSDEDKSLLPLRVIHFLDAD